MSGPVGVEDVPPTPDGQPPDRPEVELSPSREADVGGLAVRRALPQRHRRTVGAWCFADHMGPVPAAAHHPISIGPHPHIGLQTVTWLLEGEALHRDSLGSEQTIRPGQLNLMTAGAGVSHAEEPTGAGGATHGIQLWVAQPEATRHGPAAFEHHGELPRLDLGSATATVLVGTLDGVVSPARHDTPLLGVDLALRAGPTVVPLRPEHEHALVVLAGTVTVGGVVVTPGNLAYLGSRRDEVAVEVTEPTRALLLGGEPFESPVLMWWNFVARTRPEVEEARRAWAAADARFGVTGSGLARIPAPPLPWTSPA